MIAVFLNAASERAKEILLLESKPAEREIFDAPAVCRGGACMYVSSFSLHHTEVCLDCELPHRPSRAVTTGGQNSSIV